MHEYFAKKNGQKIITKQKLKQVTRIFPSFSISRFADSTRRKVGEKETE